jgi:hypothetical protein
MQAAKQASPSPTRRVASNRAKTPTKLVQHADNLRPFEDPFGDGGLKAVEEEPSSDNTAVKEEGVRVPLISPTSQSSGGTLDVDAYQYGKVDELTLSAEEALTKPGGATMAEELGASAADLDYKCPSLKELKPIGKITYLARPKEGELPRECTLTGPEFEPRQWACTTFMWKSSSLCHKPLYFEDVHLERYGHSWGPYLQPLVSGAHFFVNLPILPYKMGMYPPYECMYTLGYYRPGNCAPYMLDPLPLSVRGGLVQAGAMVGAAAVIP